MTGSGGLSPAEVRLSRQRHGANSLEKQAGGGFLPRVLEGFADPIIRILLIALAINAVFLLRGAPWPDRDPATAPRDTLIAIDAHRRYLRGEFTA